MLIKLLFDFIKTILEFLFNLLPDVPNFSSNIINSLDSYLDLIFGNLSLLGFFVDISLIKILVPLVIIVLNFEHIYHFAIWIIKKLPIGAD